MKITKVLALLSLMMILALSSCDENTTDPVDNNLAKPAPPTAMMAASIDDNGEATVGLKWTASTSEGTANFARYELTILNSSNAPVGNIINITTDNPFIVPATILNKGEVYTFELRAVNADSSSEAASIKWSPAWRFTTDQGFPIELYGSKSSFGSGLDLYDDDAQGAAVRSVSTGDMWNLGFSDKDGKLLFGSASTLGYNITPEDAEIADFVDVIGNFNESYFDKPLDQYNYSKNNIDLTQYNNSLSLVVRVRNSSGKYNYARVFIDYGSNGFVRDAGTDNQFIVVQVSYQAEVDVPYAKIDQAK